MAILVALAGTAPSAQAAATAPSASETAFSKVTASAATFSATISPGEKTTTYHFEYLTEAAYQANPEADRFAGSSLAPLPDGSISEDLGVPHGVSIRVEGLLPNIAYRFRLFAHNSKGDGTGETIAFTTYALPQSFGPCPSNEAFRAGSFAPTGNPSALLPDCRAYEQVSPVQKSGVEARGRVSMAKAAIDGEAFVFGADGNLPGAEGAQDLPSYLASRGPKGWSTQGLLPPQEEGGKAQAVGWTPDLSQTFSSAIRLGPPGDTAFLSRASAGGAITAIVPHDGGLGKGEVHLAGSGVGGEEVVFETKAKLLPSAAEGKPNVYAWDRTTGAISLAGALNGAPGGEGQAPPEGAIAGSYAWISHAASGLKEGGAAANYYTQDTHAVSSDGSVIFTSGGEGQLYERVNPTEPQSAVVVNGAGEEECTEPERACTLHLSASEKTNGHGTNGRDSAGTRPAAFLAASTDGSSVLFSSPEKLTDDATTGPEPEKEPAIASAEVSNGSGANLEFLPAHAEGIAFGGEYVYWADPTGHAIGRAKLNPGTGEPEGAPEPHFIVPEETSFETHPLAEPGVMHSAPATPRYVAVDSGHVYWTNTGPLGGDRLVNGEIISDEHSLEGAGTIGRAALDGSEELVPGSVEASFIEGATDPQGIALGVGADAEHLYWANGGLLEGSSAAVEETRTIGRAKLGGEDVEQRFIQVDENDQYFRPQGIAVDEAHIYVASNSRPFQQGRILFRYDLNGDPNSRKFIFDDEEEEQFAPGLRGIAVNGSYLYWSRQEGDSVGRIPLSELDNSGNCASIPSCEPEFIPNAGGPQGLALRGTKLYWTANQEVAPNPGNDLYRYDSDAPAGEHLTDLTPDPSEEDGARVQGILGASEDLSKIYFAANGDLDGSGPGQAGNCSGTVQGPFIEFSGQCSLYLAQARQPIRFITRLDATTEVLKKAGDAANWLPRGKVGIQSDTQFGKTARVSADGNAAIFLSQARLTAYDNEGQPELYRYEVGDTEPTCISCNPTGAPPSGIKDVSFGDVNLSTLLPNEPDLVLSRNLSANGKRAFFESASPLVAADVNGEAGCPEEGTTQQRTLSCYDAYEWEAAGEGSCEESSNAYLPQNGGCIYLLSSGTSPRASFFLDASASGRDAFIATAQAGLVGQDQDQLFDVYDAREGGGLASQNEPPPPTPCEAEACKPGATAPSQVPSPATPNFHGPGNEGPHSSPCRKGKVRRHGRCVVRHRQDKGRKGRSNHRHGGSQR